MSDPQASTEYVQLETSRPVGVGQPVAMTRRPRLWPNEFMSDSSNTYDEPLDAPQRLVLQLFDWAGLDPQQLVSNREACKKIADEIRALTAIDIVQAQTDDVVPFVFKDHVINLRPLVIPVLVAALVHVAVAVDPSLDSAIIPWLDIVAVLEKVRRVYRHLDDDEVDVFGAVSALDTLSKQTPSVTDPVLHPTAEGVQAWFERRGFQPPRNVEVILDSLCIKGALVAEDSRYAPSFLGAAD